MLDTGMGHLIDALYFSQDAPQNNIVRLLNNKVAEIHTGEKWIGQSLEETIIKMIKKTSSIALNYFGKNNALYDEDFKQGGNIMSYLLSVALCKEPSLSNLKKHTMASFSLH